MESTRLESIQIKGFRSLADVEIKDLQNSSTVLIGPNGCGKSNFFQAIEMIKYIIVYRDLEDFVLSHGGADDQLFGGRKTCTEIETKVVLRASETRHQCRLVLKVAHPDTLKVIEEQYRTVNAKNQSRIQLIGSGRELAKFSHNSSADYASNEDSDQDCAFEFIKYFKECSVHHFHDTSFHCNLKKRWDTEDNFSLLPHAGNLAPVLLRIEREDPDQFLAIRECIRHVIPNFDKFQIEERSGRAYLRWIPKGFGKTIGAHLTSDGTLRFFALATLLNLPLNMLPDTLFLDEPELGLHPAAITIIGELIHSLSVDRQVIVATQSPLLVDEFNLSEIVVLELREEQTKIRQFCGAEKQVGYRGWLERYTTGELWQKNILGGRP